MLVPQHQSDGSEVGITETFRQRGEERVPELLSILGIGWLLELDTEIRLDQARRIFSMGRPFASSSTSLSM
jgi:hypothetical protein